MNVKLLALTALHAFALGCVARPGPPTGQCLFDSDCAQGLVCASRYCRTRCMTNADCTALGAGAYCVPSAEDPQKSACVLPASQERSCAYSSDCHTGESCGPTGVCQAQCAQTSDCALFGTGLQCTDGSCALAPTGDAGPTDAGPSDAASGG